MAFAGWKRKGWEIAALFCLGTFYGTLFCWVLWRDYNHCSIDYRYCSNGII